MIALFADQITEHESLAEHYLRLAQESERLAQALKAIEERAVSGIEIFAQLTKEISDSKAIATLKAAVLNVFPGDSDPGAGGSPVDPTPSPEPTNPSGDEQTFPVASNEIDSMSEEPDPLQVQQDSSEPEIIYHPENQAVAWLAGEDESGKLVAVLGFDRKGVAASWEKFILPMSVVELSEEPKFLVGYKYELRCFGLSMSQITRIAGYDLSRKHTVCVENIGASVPTQSVRKFALPTVKVGDRVTRLLTPSVEYEVTSPVAKDGTFFAKSMRSGDRALFSLEDVNIISPAPEVKFAKVLLANDEFHGQTLPIFDESDAYLNLKAPNGQIISYKRDVVQVVDAEIEGVADPTEPVENSPILDVGDLHPATQRPNLVQPAFSDFPGGAPEANIHSVLEIDDIVEIISDRYPQFLGQVGTVEEISTGMPPIVIKAPRGMKPYHRHELKLISKKLPIANISEPIDF